MTKYKRKKKPLQRKFLIRRIVFCFIVFAFLALLTFGVVKLIGAIIGSGKQKGPVYTSGIYEVNTAGGPSADMLLTELGKKEAANGATIVFAEDSPVIDYRKPGIYELKTIYTDPRGNQTVYRTKLTVRDTTAPTGIAVDQTVLLGQKLDMQAFFRDVQDNSGTDVYCYYAQEPDFNRVGIQSVVILLRDTSGNESRITAKLTVTKEQDRIPPVITGAQDRVVYIGEAIAYKKGITVTDNSGEDITLEVDISAVKPDTVGEYPVVYSAQDSAGNKTTVQVIFTVAVKPGTSLYDLETVYEKADTILKEILKDGMSETEKCKAIYVYIRSHMSYVNQRGDVTDWMLAAWQAMRTGSGDCFSYYSYAKLLLTRAGFQNQKVFVSRTDGSRHYWSLVKIETGWYHFDTTPRKAGGDFCLLTDSEILAYSTSHSNSHAFNTADYPATPKESLGIKPWG